jgi:hypothetical protein
MARLPETSESWVNAILFVMNLAKLLQVAERWKGSFALFLKKIKAAIKNLLRLELFDENILLVPISNSYGV